LLWLGYGDCPTDRQNIGSDLNVTSGLGLAAVSSMLMMTLAELFTSCVISLAETVGQFSSLERRLMRYVDILLNKSLIVR
jgi:hypothetical protein